MLKKNRPKILVFKLFKLKFKSLKKFGFQILKVKKIKMSKI